MAGRPENTERTAIETPRRRRRLVDDGWVSGPAEEARSAFRWWNEAGIEEEMLTQRQDYYQWQWPVARLGASWHGMFMRGDGRYDIGNTPSCKGILPTPPDASLPILGWDIGETEFTLLGKVQRMVERNESIPPGLLAAAPKER
ncbi:unnamed protein product [Closterium sp. Naga37s-1]|nr:unnamed protein product [Closterium sp. Naga37s-1]